jgi:hypothetical protein
VDWSRFFEGILTHWVWELLTIAYGVLVGYLKRTNSTWFLPALWGAIGALIMATALYVGSLVNQKENPIINQDNSEEVVRSWLDSYAVVRTRIALQNELLPNQYFRIESTYPSGDTVNVVRLKGHEGYIVTYADLVIAQEHLDKIKKLSQADQADLQQVMSIAMANTGTEFVSDATKAFHVEKRIPISGLTEFTFINNLEDVDRAIILARATLITELDHRLKPQSHPVP